MVLDKDSGKIHKLNETASEIWKLVCAGKSDSDMIQYIRETYQVSEELARYDVDKVLHQLKEQQLIE